MLKDLIANELSIRLGCHVAAAVPPWEDSILFATPSFSVGRLDAATIREHQRASVGRLADAVVWCDLARGGWK